MGKGWNFDGYYKFATVRNPLARLASLYNMTRRNWGEQWDVSFSEWIKSLDPTGRSTSNMSEKWYAHGTMSMVKFLSGQNGNILVDTVFGLRIKPRPFTPIPKRAWVWIAFNAD